MSKQDDIGRLIRDAGTRESVSLEQLQTAYARVNDHWTQTISERRQQRTSTRAPYVAIAAALVLAVTIGFLYPRSDTPTGSPAFATINRIVGEVLVDGTPTALGAAVNENSRVETLEDSYVAMDLESGQSLRIDERTLLTAGSGNTFALSEGRIYVDSDLDSRATPVFVETHLGTATDVGTQFQVRIDSTSLQIGVREGLVALNRIDGQATQIPLGTLFELTANGDSIERDISTDDEIWSWTSSILPNFNTDGASLAEYLAWFARESGLRLEWLDAASKTNADRVVLDGSIEGLSLEQGLDAINKIAPFEYTLADGVMTVEVQ